MTTEGATLVKNDTGFLVVLSGPSGVGKTTLAKKLVQDGVLTKVTTSTTRARRPQEQDGRDYNFLGRAEFEAGIRRGEFLEHAEIDGNLYGTPKATIERAIAAGQHVLVDIDPQGAESIRALGLPAIYIFLAPPDMDELRRRLEGRATESPEDLRRRLERAEREMARKDEYDTVLVNMETEETAARIVAEVEKRKPPIGRNA